MSRRGFTLIELLIVVVISVVIGIVAFANYSGKQGKTSMQAVSQEAATSLREAQSRTLAGDENGTSWEGFWGIKFSNSTSTPAYFALFYATTTTAVASGTVSLVNGDTDLPPGIAYATSSVASGGSMFVYFSNGTAPAGMQPGAYAYCQGFSCPATSTITVSLYTPTQQPSLSSTLTIAPTGEVSY
jgi:prepilin-type N-terminal cleavage/methylation domain-containing protein